MNRELFQAGNYTLSSGKPSWWKVECNSFTEREWDTLARVSIELWPHLRKLHPVGIPTGGSWFADALRPYCSVGADMLIVDDVLTTGQSIQMKRDELNSAAPAIVAFDRSEGMVVVNNLYVLWTLGCVS